MKMQIIITGITNMKDDYICVSGYDIEKGVYRRPLLMGSRLSSSFLNQLSGFICIGSQIEFELIPPPHIATPPHREDIWIDSDSVVLVRQMEYSLFREFIHTIVDEDIVSIYGHEIELLDGQPVLPKGYGEKSLGAIICRKCSVYNDYMGKTRCDLVDRSGSMYRKIPVVARDEFYKKLGEYADIPLRMGLSRPFRKTNQEEEYCWVHVSAVFSL